MALTKIEDIFLYTSNVLQPIETHELMAWFDHSGIPYSLLNYGDQSNVDVVLSALNTWWAPDPLTNERQPDVTEFPLVVYSAYYDGYDTEYRKYIQGKENIISQISDLYSIGK